MYTHTHTHTCSLYICTQVHICMRMHLWYLYIHGTQVWHSQLRKYANVICTAVRKKQFSVCTRARAVKSQLRTCGVWELASGVCVCVRANDLIPLTAQLLDDDHNTALHADLSAKQHTSEVYDDVGVRLARSSLNRFKPRRSVQKFDLATRRRFSREAAWRSLPLSLPLSSHLGRKKEQVFRVKKLMGRRGPLNSNYLLLLLYCSHPYYMKP